MLASDSTRITRKSNSASPHEHFLQLGRPPTSRRPIRGNITCCKKVWNVLVFTRSRIDPVKPVAPMLLGHRTRRCVARFVKHFAHSVPEVHSSDATTWARLRPASAASHHYAVRLFPYRRLLASAFHGSPSAQLVLCYGVVNARV